MYLLGSALWRACSSAVAGAARRAPPMSPLAASAAEASTSISTVSWPARACAAVLLALPLP
eukprot:14569123-Alexandrium_andersonii.AAC.1